LQARKTRPQHPLGVDVSTKILECLRADLGNGLERLTKTHAATSTTERRTMIFGPL
jgi:hypothetical protein